MNPTDAGLKPDQAREQLHQADKARLASRTDRIVHALCLAISGVAVSVMMVFARDAATGLQQTVATALFFALIGGILFVVERGSQAAPRHARRLGLAALLASMLVALVVALPIINLREQASVVPLGMELGLAALVALPAFIAAGMVARNPS